jgi:hypothetical protein
MEFPMAKPTRPIVALIALIATVPLPIALRPVPALAAAAEQVPSAKELEAVKARFDKAIDDERRKMGVAALDRTYPVRGGQVHANTGEEALTFEVIPTRPLSRTAAQQVAKAIFTAFDEKATIDFAKVYKATPQSLLYVWTYDVKTTQAGPKDEPEGAGCSIELKLDRAGHVTRVVYISGS